MTGRRVAGFLEAESLEHRYPDGFAALNGVDLSIPEGQVVLLAGANGSGKSTLLRHFNGLLRATAGEVRVDGVSVRKNPEAARRKVGMVFQDADTQIVGDTVFDDTAFGPRNLGLSPEETVRRTRSALAATGLTHLADRMPHTLSGGQKRRLAVAGILAMESRAVLLDEPFSNLDYPGVRQVLDQLYMLRGRGHTLLVTTHDLDKVLHMADRLIIMHQGRITADGPPVQVLENSGHRLEEWGVRNPLSGWPVSGASLPGPQTIAGKNPAARSRRQAA